MKTVSKVAPKLTVEPRQEQETPAAMVGELMGVIRKQFYGDACARAWARDSHYIEREIVLWPASWMRQRGLTMGVTDYRRLFLEKIQDVKRNCRVGDFKYFPAYLRRCIQDHFRHNEDVIYEAGKAARGSVATVLARLPKQAAPVDAVAPLTAARDVLLANRRARKPAARREAAAEAKQGVLW